MEDGAERRASEHPWWRLLQSALSPFPKLSALMSGLMGFGLVAGAIFAMIAWWHLAAAFPIAVLFVGLFWWSGVRAIREHDAARAEWQAKQPMIVFGNEVTDSGPFGLYAQEHLSEESTGLSTGSTRRFIPPDRVTIRAARITVRNDVANRNPEAEVADAVAELAFFAREQDTAPIETTDGRWADNQQAITRDLGEPVDDLKRRALRVTGESNTIDLVYRYSPDGSCYPGALDVLRSGFDKRFMLAGSEFLIRVIIRGSRLPGDAEAWYRVRCQREGGLEGERVAGRS
jgi:hypothetical protein